MRLLITICLLTASWGVLGQTIQTSGTITQQPNHQTLEQQCNSQVNNCGFLTLDGPTAGQKIIPSPIWVPDPSAGHYDCPDGWAAYKRSEPRVYGVYAVPAIGHNPKLDKKGHALEEQPSPAICIQEKP